MSSLVALYALPLVGGRWFRFVGSVERLPIRPFWEECFSYEDFQGRTRPETDALCRRLGIDVLFLIHVQNNARGALLREKFVRVEEDSHGMATATSRR